MNIVSQTTADPQLRAPYQGNSLPNWPALICIAVALAGMVGLYWDGLVRFFCVWSTQPEYSHGYPDCTDRALPVLEPARDRATRVDERQSGRGLGVVVLVFAIAGRPARAISPTCRTSTPTESSCASPAWS